jgi:hypothetical protein
MSARSRKGLWNRPSAVCNTGEKARPALGRAVRRASMRSRYWATGERLATTAARRFRLWGGGAQDHQSVWLAAEQPCSGRRRAEGMAPALREASKALGAGAAKSAAISASSIDRLAPCQAGLEGELVAGRASEPLRKEIGSHGALGCKHTGLYRGRHRGAQGKYGWRVLLGHSDRCATQWTDPRSAQSPGSMRRRRIAEIEAALPLPS